MMAGSNHGLPLALALAVALAWALPISAQSRHAEAHVHGTGNMTLLVAGSAVSIQLAIPGSDIVGFERAAQTPEEQSAVDSAIDALSRPLDLFAFSPDPACTAIDVLADFGVHEEADEGHAEFTAIYTLDCPGLATQNLELQTRLFDQFDHAETLDVQALIDGAPVLLALSRQQPTMALR